MSIRVVATLMLVVFVGCAAFLHGMRSFGVSQALAADPGDCISAQPSGCYGNPHLPEKRTPENTTIISDPVPAGHGDTGVAMALAALRVLAGAALSDKPVMTVSTANVINARIDRQARRAQNINQEIKVHCRTVTKVMVAADVGTGMSSSYEYEETVCE